MKISDVKVGVFEQRFKKERNVRVRERLQILWYLRQGYTQREVSSMLSVSTGIVPFWKKRFEKEGFTGLADKEGRGRVAQLTENELSMIGSALDDGVLLEDNYRRGFITKDVVAFIKREFNIDYTVRHCRRLMQWIGCSMQVPRPRNKSRNQEEVDQFKREFKKKAIVWTFQ